MIDCMYTTRTISVEELALAARHPMTKRIEFPKQTKRLVAERCAYRCSFPSCNKPTIGPGPTSRETTITGEAAHIFSASPGGPRGQRGLSHDEIQSVNNAIWLCSYHASLVDKHRGESFSPELLLSYKGLREAQAAREQNGIGAPFGWFHELLIRDSPIFTRNARIHFGNVTVIVGDNDSGKTAICDWLAGLADLGALGRWERPRGRQLCLEMTFFDPVEHHVRLNVPESNVIQYFVDEQEVPFCPFKMGIVRVPEYVIPRQFMDDEPVDELQLVSDILRVHPSIIRNVLPHVPQSNERSLTDLRLSLDGQRWQIFAHHEHESDPWSFLALSDSQQAMVLIELAAVIARFSAKFMPTVLLLDGGVNFLDAANFSRYAEYLGAPTNNFQTIIMLIRPPTRDLSDRWRGWEFARLVGKRSDVVIDQSPF